MQTKLAEQMLIKKNSKLSKNMMIALGLVALSMPTIIDLYAGDHSLSTFGIPVWAQCILLILTCCLIIWRASDGFETASDYFGDQFNMEGGIKGATINAVGSSLPELFTTFFFLVVLKDANGFAGGIGTTAGSAIFNSMIIPASVILAVVFTSKNIVTVNSKVILRDGLFLIGAEMVLVIFLSGDYLGWMHGVILMLVYVLYILLLKFVKIESSEEDEEEEEDTNELIDTSLKGRMIALFKLDLESLLIGNKNLSHGGAALLLVAATLVMGVACHLLAEACNILGGVLEIHPFIIAIVFAAAATSVPDTILSIRDAQKGNYDDAVANALGSNIFDICFALGLPLAIYTIANGDISMVGDGISQDAIGQFRVLLLIFTVIAFFVYISGKKMGKGKASALLGLYVLFLAYTIGYAYDQEWIKGIQTVLLDINAVFRGMNPFQ